MRRCVDFGEAEGGSEVAGGSRVAGGFGVEVAVGEGGSFKGNFQLRFLGSPLAKR